MATAAVASTPETMVGSQQQTDLRFSRQILWLFMLGHLVAWTSVAVLTQPNAPVDTVEMVYWGHQWEWGYHKHPPLPSWVCETLVVLGGGSVWMTYLAAQIAVVVCFWAAWRLALEMVPPRTALLAACLLECCYYYNFTSVELNNNVGMYPFWALAVLSLYAALKRDRYRDWVATGVWLGLGMLSKYSMALLVLTMLAFGLINRKARSAWSRPGPYLTLLVALLIFSPHAYWAISYRFPGVGWALESTQAGRQPAVRHLLYPLEFALAQLWALTPMIVVALPLTGYHWRLRRVPGARDGLAGHHPKVGPATRFDRDFLVALGLGPFLAHLALSPLVGVRLHSMYGSQLWTFAGLLMLFCLQTRDIRLVWRKVLIGCCTMGVVFLAAAVIRNVAGPYVRGKSSRVHFPGRALATQVDRLWNRRYDRPLPIVAGEWWLAANTALYGPSRPTVYGGRLGDSLDFAPRYSPWTSDEDLKRRGGVILWDSRRSGEGLPRELRQRFRHAEVLPPLTIPYQTGAKIPPARIGVAVVPPGGDQPQTVLEARPPNRSVRR
jgi:4-amino-4-deoxy-L-arabinose transferase-like glycosyltransferase